MPALFTRISGPKSSTVFLKFSTESTSEISSSATVSLSFSKGNLDTSLHVARTSFPLSKNPSTIPFPIPLFPPVTSTFLVSIFLQ